MCAGLFSASQLEVRSPSGTRFSLQSEVYVVPSGGLQREGKKGREGAGEGALAEDYGPRLFDLGHTMSAYGGAEKISAITALSRMIAAS